MAGDELFVLTDNVLSDLLNPGFVLTASEEAAGHPVSRIVGVRRHAANFWAATSANTDVTITIDCLTAVPVSALIIDRNGNHAGMRFILARSSDGAAWTDIVDSTTPSSASGTPAGTNGCTTTEGAWWKTFTEVTYRYYRITSKAMGAGIVAQLGGVWLGQAWMSANQVIVSPYDDESVEMSSEVVTSPAGWRGRSRIARPRTAVLPLRPADATDEANIRTHVFEPMSQGIPAWICWQRTTEPTRLVLATAPDGVQTFARTPDWYLRQYYVPYIEEQPLAA